MRVDADFSATPFKAKISNAEQLRVHTMLVIGGRDMEAGQVSVRLHHGGPQGAKPKAEAVADILAAIKERRRDVPSKTTRAGEFVKQTGDWRILCKISKDNGCQTIVLAAW